MNVKYIFLKDKVRVIDFILQELIIKHHICMGCMFMTPKMIRFGCIENSSEFYLNQMSIPYTDRVKQSDTRTSFGFWWFLVSGKTNVEHVWSAFVVYGLCPDTANHRVVVRH
jgi:hypothetical protein